MIVMLNKISVTFNQMSKILKPMSDGVASDVDSKLAVFVIIKKMLPLAWNTMIVDDIALLHLSTHHLVYL